MLDQSGQEARVPGSGSGNKGIGGGSAGRAGVCFMCANKRVHVCMFC